MSPPLNIILLFITLMISNHLSEGAKNRRQEKNQRWKGSRFSNSEIPRFRAVRGGVQELPHSVKRNSPRNERFRDIVATNQNRVMYFRQKSTNRKSPRSSFSQSHDQGRVRGQGRRAVLVQHYPKKTSSAFVGTTFIPRKDKRHKPSFKNPEIELLLVPNRFQRHFPLRKKKISKTFFNPRRGRPTVRRKETLDNRYNKIVDELQNGRRPRRYKVRQRSVLGNRVAENAIVTLVGRSRLHKTNPSKQRIYVSNKRPSFRRLVAPSSSRTLFRSKVANSKGQGRRLVMVSEGQIGSRTARHQEHKNALQQKELLARDSSAQRAIMKLNVQSSSTGNLLKKIDSPDKINSKSSLLPPDRPVRNEDPAILEYYDYEFQPQRLAEHTNGLIGQKNNGGQQLSHHWSYKGQEGPGNWSAKYPACTGTRQSPVDIRDRNIVYQELPPFLFSGYNGRMGTFRLTNNGHTSSISVTGDLFIEGGGLDGRYKTAELHFHWGGMTTPGSEHSVNGRKYALEMHIVNYAVKYGSFENAMKFRDGLAVLGTFFDLGRQNPYFISIQRGLRRTKYVGNSTTLEPINLRRLLPLDTTRFYRYYGSLTTPPCYQSVVWTVFEEVQYMTSYQLRSFFELQEMSGSHVNHQAINFNLKAHLPTEDVLLKENNRPIQPDFDRVVLCTNPRYKDPLFVLRPQQPLDTNAHADNFIAQRLSQFNVEHLFNKTLTKWLQNKGMTPDLFIKENSPKKIAMEQPAIEHPNPVNRQAYPVTSRPTSSPAISLEPNLDELDLDIIQSHSTGPNGERVSEIKVQVDPNRLPKGVSPQEVQKLLRDPKIVEQISQLLTQQGLTDGKRHEIIVPSGSKTSSQGNEQQQSDSPVPNVRRIISPQQLSPVLSMSSIPVNLLSVYDSSVSNQLTLKSDLLSSNSQITLQSMSVHRRPDNSVYLTLAVHVPDASSPVTTSAPTSSGHHPLLLFRSKQSAAISQNNDTLKPSYLDFSTGNRSDTDTPDEQPNLRDAPHQQQQAKDQNITNVSEQPQTQLDIIGVNNNQRAPSSTTTVAQKYNTVQNVTIQNLSTLKPMSIPTSKKEVSDNIIYRINPDQVPHSNHLRTSNPVTPNTAIAFFIQETTPKSFHKVAVRQKARSHQLSKLLTRNVTLNSIAATAGHRVKRFTKQASKQYGQFSSVSTNTVQSLIIGTIESILKDNGMLLNESRRVKPVTPLSVYDIPINGSLDSSKKVSSAHTNEIKLKDRIGSFHRSRIIRYDPGRTIQNISSADFTILANDFDITQFVLKPSSQDTMISTNMAGSTSKNATNKGLQFKLADSGRKIHAENVRLNQRTPQTAVTTEISPNPVTPPPAVKQVTTVSISVAGATSPHPGRLAEQTISTTTLSSEEFEPTINAGNSNSASHNNLLENSAGNKHPQPILEQYPSLTTVAYEHLQTTTALNTVSSDNRIKTPSNVNRNNMLDVRMVQTQNEINILNATQITIVNTTDTAADSQPVFKIPEITDPEANMNHSENTSSVPVSARIKSQGIAEDPTSIKSEASLPLTSAETNKSGKSLNASPETATLKMFKIITPPPVPTIETEQVSRLYSKIRQNIVSSKKISKRHTVSPFQEALLRRITPEANQVSISSNSAAGGPMEFLQTVNPFLQFNALASSSSNFGLTNSEVSTLSGYDSLSHVLSAPPPTNPKQTNQNGLDPLLSLPVFLQDKTTSVAHVSNPQSVHNEIIPNTQPVSSANTASNAASSLATVEPLPVLIKNVQGASKTVQVGTSQPKVTSPKPIADPVQTSQNSQSKSMTDALVIPTEPHVKVIPSQVVNPAPAPTAPELTSVSLGTGAVNDPAKKRVPETKAGSNVGLTEPLKIFTPADPIPGPGTSGAVTSTNVVSGQISKSLSVPAAGPVVAVITPVSPPGGNQAAQPSVNSVTSKIVEPTVPPLVALTAGSPLIPVGEATTSSGSAAIVVGDASSQSIPKKTGTSPSGINDAILTIDPLVSPVLQGASNPSLVEGKPGQLQNRPTSEVLVNPLENAQNSLSVGAGSVSSKLDSTLGQTSPVNRVAQTAALGASDISAGVIQQQLDMNPVSNNGSSLVNTAAAMNSAGNIFMNPDSLFLNNPAFLLNNNIHPVDVISVPQNSLSSGSQGSDVGFLDANAVPSFSLGMLLPDTVNIEHPPGHNKQNIPPSAPFDAEGLFDFSKSQQTEWSLHDLKKTVKKINKPKNVGYSESFTLDNSGIPLSVLKGTSGDILEFLDASPKTYHNSKSTDITKKGTFNFRETTSLQSKPGNFKVKTLEPKPTSQTTGSVKTVSTNIGQDSPVVVNSIGMDIPSSTVDTSQLVTVLENLPPSVESGPVLLDGIPSNAPKSVLSARQVDTFSATDVGSPLQPEVLPIDQSFIPQESMGSQTFGGASQRFPPDLSFQGESINPEMGLFEGGTQVLDPMDARVANIYPAEMMLNAPVSVEASSLNSGIFEPFQFPHDPTPNNIVGGQDIAGPISLPSMSKESAPADMMSNMFGTLTGLENPSFGKSTVEPLVHEALSGSGIDQPFGGSAGVDKSMLGTSGVEQGVSRLFTNKREAEMIARMLEGGGTAETVSKPSTGMFLPEHASQQLLDPRPGLEPGLGGMFADKQQAEMMVKMLEAGGTQSVELPTGNSLNPSHSQEVINPAHSAGLEPLFTESVTSSQEPNALPMFHNTRPSIQQDSMHLISDPQSFPNGNRRNMFMPEVISTTGMNTAQNVGGQLEYEPIDAAFRISPQSRRQAKYITLKEGRVVENKVLSQGDSFTSNELNVFNERQTSRSSSRIAGIPFQDSLHQNHVKFQYQQQNNPSGRGTQFIERPNQPTSNRRKVSIPYKPTLQIQSQFRSQTQSRFRPNNSPSTFQKFESPSPSQRAQNNNNNIAGRRFLQNSPAGATNVYSRQKIQINKVQTASPLQSNSHIQHPQGTLRQNAVIHQHQNQAKASRGPVVSRTREQTVSQFRANGQPYIPRPINSHAANQVTKNQRTNQRLRTRQGHSVEQGQMPRIQQPFFQQPHLLRNASQQRRRQLQQRRNGQRVMQDTSQQRRRQLQQRRNGQRVMQDTNHPQQTSRPSAAAPFSQTRPQLQRNSVSKSQPQMPRQRRPAEGSRRLQQLPQRRVRMKIDSPNGRLMQHQPRAHTRPQSSRLALSSSSQHTFPPSRQMSEYSQRNAVGPSSRTARPQMSRQTPPPRQRQVTKMQLAQSPRHMMPKRPSRHMMPQSPARKMAPQQKHSIAAQHQRPLMSPVQKPQRHRRHMLQQPYSSAASKKIPRQRQVTQRQQTNTRPAPAPTRTVHQSRGQNGFSSQNQRARSQVQQRQITLSWRKPSPRKITRPRRNNLRTRRPPL